MIKLQTLDKLNKGIYKQWIWGNEDNYHKMCDYLEKIRYSIQDLNEEIDVLPSATRKDIIYVIVLVDWICEACTAIPKLLRSDIHANCSSNEDNLQQSLSYFKAIRSFAIAHPLSTNRHKKYGFDGDKICVDIRKELPLCIKAFVHNCDCSYLDFLGPHPKDEDMKADFVLCSYSNKLDKNHFYKYIFANFTDLYNVARLQIGSLYDLAKYLGKIKMKDYVTK